MVNDQLADFPSLPFSSMSYPHLQKWLSDSEDLVSNYAPLSPSMVRNLYLDYVENDDEPTCVSDYFLFQMKPYEGTDHFTDLLQDLAAKINENLNVFVDIECLEFGINRKIAHQRVTLLYDHFKLLPNFWKQMIDEFPGHYLTASTSSNVSDRVSPLVSLFYEIAASILNLKSECSYRIHESKLYSFLVFYNILKEAGLAVSLNKDQWYGEEEVDKSLVPIECEFTGKDTPMLVLYSADLNSAVDCSVSAAWFSNGLVSWATTSILVQESIYDDFISRFKARLLNSLEDHITLYSNLILDCADQDNIKRIVTEAKSRHLDVFEFETKDDSLKPTVIFGDYVSCPVVTNLMSHHRPIPIIFVVPFRTANEGISLANESSRKLAISVWSESYSTCMSAVSQLDFGTVWLNSSGVFDVKVPFFRRTNNFHPEYLISFEALYWNHLKVKSNIVGTIEDESFSYYEGEEIIHELLNASYEAYCRWKNTSACKKTQILDKISQALEAVKDEKLSLPRKFKNSLMARILNISQSYSQFIKDCAVVQITEPIGIIIIILQNYNGSPNTLLNLVLSALFTNNSVILGGTIADEIIKLVSPFLPKNILSATNESIETFCRILKNHKLKNNVDVWCYHSDSAVFRNYKIDVRHRKHFDFCREFDIKNHVMKRKVLWMPLC